MKLYFDGIQESQNILWYFGIGLFVLIITLLGLIYVIIKRKSSGWIVQFAIYVVFSSAWTGTVWNMGTKQYLEAKNADENEALGKVEGVVENFIPMADFGDGVESFNVKGTHFEYTCRERNYGFNSTKSVGGPIDEGKYVKIHYLDGRILRLWIKD